MTPCGVAWPVCPNCLGEGLVTSAGRSRCQRCGREWRQEQREPCPDPATVVLADDAGDKGRVCESHAAHPSAAELRKALRPVRAGEVPPAVACLSCGAACTRVDDLPLPPGVRVRAWSGPAFVCGTCGKAWTAAEVRAAPGTTLNSPLWKTP